MLPKSLACMEEFRIAGKGGNPRLKKLMSKRLKLCTDLLNFFSSQSIKKRWPIEAKGIHDSPPENSEEGLQGKNPHEFNRKAK